MPKNDFREKLALILACLVTGAWIVSLGLDVFLEEFDVWPGFTLLMPAVAGFLFGGDVIKNLKSNNEDKETAV